MIRKSLRKIIQQLLFIFCTLRKKKYFQLISQKLIRIVKRNDFISDSKQRKKRMALFCKKKTVYIIKKNNIRKSGSFFCLNYLHSLEQKIILNLMKTYLKKIFLCNYNAIRKGKCIRI